MPKFSTVFVKLILVCLFSFTLCGCGGGSADKPWQAPADHASRPAKQNPDDLSAPAPASAPTPAPDAQNADTATQAPNIDLMIANQGLPPVKVAILLPLSGENRNLGETLLNAAQMAVFDIGFNSFELIPIDTKGTHDGARDAATAAAQKNVDLVIGPVFSPEVKAARLVLQDTNINMISFSTDWSLIGKNTYLIGFLPFDQVQRVVSYAAEKGYRKIGVLAPSDNYGSGVTSAFQSYAQEQDLPPARIARFTPQDGQNLGPIIQEFSDFDARKSLKDQNNMADYPPPPFDAVLMPLGGSMARQAANFLSTYGLYPHQVKRLGTGLLDDNSLATEKNMDGAWFAAPDPALRQNFERQYNNIYGVKPPRISSLSYDATALAIVLARNGLKESGKPAYDNASLTNPNGFAGVDGIFRFRSDGIAERGLAVLGYSNARIIVIDHAPKTFQKNKNTQ